MNWGDDSDDGVDACSMAVRTTECGTTLFLQPEMGVHKDATVAWQNCVTQWKQKSDGVYTTTRLPNYIETPPAPDQFGYHTVPVEVPGEWVSIAKVHPYIEDTRSFATSITHQSASTCLFVVGPAQHFRFLGQTHPRCLYFSCPEGYHAWYRENYM